MVRQRDVDGGKLIATVIEHRRQHDLASSEPLIPPVQAMARRSTRRNRGGDWYHLTTRWNGRECHGGRKRKSRCWLLAEPATEGSPVAQLAVAIPVWPEHPPPRRKADYPRGVGAARPIRVTTGAIPRDTNTAAPPGDHAGWCSGSVSWQCVALGQSHKSCAAKGRYTLCSAV